ncbi:MAG: CPBP family intramembrane metalloprotease [Planctomycetes bacterium]|nr:CPBP family intramembrane metalloprotease [Planctomycetota bacterium]
MKKNCTLTELAIVIIVIIALEIALSMIFSESYLQGVAEGLLKHKAGLVETATGFKAGSKDCVSELYTLLGLYFTLFVRLMEFICLFMLLRFVLRKDAGALGMDFSKAGKSALFGTIVSAAMGILVFAAAGAYYVLTGENIFRFIGGTYYTGAFPAIAVLIPVAIVGPFIEEVIFRGILYGSIRGITGVWRGIIISALIFSSLHFVNGAGGLAELLQTFVITFTGGVIFAWIYEKSGDILGPYIVHFLGNAALFLLPKIIK